MTERRVSEPPAPRTPHNHELAYRAMDFNATPEQVELLRRLYTPQQYDLIRSCFHTMVEVANTVVERIAEAMKGMGLSLDPGEEHDDPRQRALALRRNRNTGPALPSGPTARRPRRHQ